MDFNTFPAQWEWVALIIGAVAFVMAIQPFTQLIWGKPLIDITFHQFTDNDIKTLCFDITNEPITKGILPKLGVYRRTAEGVRADFYIFDSSGNKELAEELEATIVIADKEQKQISLPAAMTDASVMVVETHPNGTSNILTTPKINPMPIGLYMLVVIVTYEGKLKSQKRLFTIGDTPDGTYWVNT